MGGAGKFAVVDGGNYGILPNGKFAIFNAAGNACDCCGPEACVDPRVSVEAEFATSLFPSGFSEAVDDDLWHITGGELICSLDTTGRFATGNYLLQDFDKYNRAANVLQIFEAEIRFKFDSWATITGTGPGASPSTYVHQGFFSWANHTCEFSWTVGGMVLKFRQQLAPSNTPEYTSRKSQLSTQYLDGFSTVTETADISAPGLADDSYHTLTILVHADGSDMRVDDVSVLSTTGYSKVGTACSTATFQQSIKESSGRTRSDWLDFLKIDYLRQNFGDP